MIKRMMSMTKEKNIGERIKKIRTGHGLTASKFAEKIGIAQSAITRIENNEANPRTETIVSLYKNFGIDPLWLLIGESRSSEIKSQTALKIGTIAEQLPEEIRKEYLAAMERDLLLQKMIEKEQQVKKASSE